MKKLKISTIVLLCFIQISCTTSKSLYFSNQTWNFSTKTGYVINNDSTFQFDMGYSMQSPNMSFINCLDSAKQYKGSEKYISHILSLCKLDSAKIMFFIPEGMTMWVELPENLKEDNPRSISSNLTDEKPYTSWVWDDDTESKKRTPDEIYSNSYYDKHNKLLLLVDRMTYWNKSLACIHIYQSATKNVRKLQFIRPTYMYCNDDLFDKSHIEILANWIDCRRKLLFTNYKLGLEAPHRKHINDIREELKLVWHADQDGRVEILKAWAEQPNDTLLHKKIAAGIIHNDSINLIKVTDILENNALEFGEENEVIWTVIQHSSLDLQNKYLPKFIEAAKKGLLKKECVALMQDRILCRMNKPQIYGSQGNIDKNGIFVPASIEDIDKVDQRRASMDMVPLKDYIKRMSRHKK